MADAPLVRSIRRLAIANRGEVAVRIIRACQELGIETVLLHSEADSGGLAYRTADHTVCIGPAPSIESYLSITRNVEGARSLKCDAVHPGFGFLSENAEFAKAVTEAGMIFVGPSPESIALMGDKISARKVMGQAGVPVIPGYHGNATDLNSLRMEADRIGYPLIIKAAAGGGGRGMKVVRRPEDFQDQLASAQRESKAAFGSEVVFMEKYIEAGKHIEFQILGDGRGRAVSLFERECSVQRRHQKMIEEALSPSLTPELRKEMGRVSAEAARVSKYAGAGTVEFLLDGDHFYFLEMNTRLQVEHTVTEQVVGVDLVKAQIRVAEGLGLPWTEAELRPQGHSIECRIYAEDPYAGGIPSTGKVPFVSWPYGPGRRFETAIESGDEVSPFYDPMIAKVVVWDATRSAAIHKMIRTLEDSVIFGIKTNIPLLREILSHKKFQDGTMNIQFINTFFPEGLAGRNIPESAQALAQKLWKEQRNNLEAAPPLGTSLTSANISASAFEGRWRNA